MLIRVAFPTNKGGLDDEIYPRFGRAPTFTIVDVENGEIRNVKVVENPGARSGSGAGIKAVQKLVDENVSVVVGPNPGPNALMALQQAGIRVINILGVKVREALQQIIDEL